MSNFRNHLDEQLKDEKLEKEWKNSEIEVYQMKVEDHIFWVAKSRILKGCVGQGETAHEAIKELADNERDWIETAKSVQIPIPEGGNSSATLHTPYKIYTKSFFQSPQNLSTMKGDRSDRKEEKNERTEDKKK